MVELIQVVFPWEDGPVGHHLSQDAAHGPDVNGLGVSLNEYGLKCEGVFMRGGGGFDNVFQPHRPLS